jgi:pSer/pThr/pTyr-binding forkhead associated (FHA) protein
VVFRGGCWTVEDLGSRNGTLVNGVRVERHELRRGDVVGFAAVSAQLAWGS